MSETTGNVLTNAGAWEQLYPLIVARRTALNQAPIPFTSCRRIILLASGAVLYCKDPKANPVGVTVSVTPNAPTMFDGGGAKSECESLRSFYVKGGGLLEVTIDY